MARGALSLLRWHLGYAWRRAGWELAVAVVLLVAAALLAWQKVALSEEVQGLRTALDEQARKPQPVASEGSAVETARRLESFYAQLPEEEELAGQVKRLFAVAEKNQVRLAQGEYHPVHESAARLVKYQVTLPVKGEAARLQGFMLDALAELPALGLESVAFKRESAESGEIEARLRFFLLARPR